MDLRLYRRLIPLGCFYHLMPCCEKPYDRLPNAGGKSDNDETDNYGDSTAEPTV